MQRKKWKKPELIVLVRGEPDEAILQTCKRSGVYTGPVSNFGACMGPIFITLCGSCQSPASS